MLALDAALLWVFVGDRSPSVIPPALTLLCGTLIPLGTLLAASAWRTFERGLAARPAEIARLRAGAIVRGATASTLAVLGATGLFCSIFLV